MGRTILVLGLLVAALLISGCRCCPQGGPNIPTDAACRGTCWGPCWPLERNNLGTGEVQLTPSLNKAFNCPGYSEGFKYTQLPWRCDTRYDK